ncbi:MAG: hypothetical protein ACE5GV_12470 [Candidatus Scalindua sp.]
MKCLLCNKELAKSKKYPRVKCCNQTCTTYEIIIDIKKYEYLMRGFLKFWDVYPRKEGKKSAIRAWIKLAPLDDLIKDIVVSVVAHTMNAAQWENKQFVPLPASFINGRKWEDEIVKKARTNSYNAPIYSNVDEDGYFKKDNSKKEKTEEEKRKSEENWLKVKKRIDEIFKRKGGCHESKR